MREGVWWVAACCLWVFAILQLPSKHFKGVRFWVFYLEGETVLKRIFEIVTFSQLFCLFVCFVKWLILQILFSALTCGWWWANRNGLSQFRALLRQWNEMARFFVFSCSFSFNRSQTMLRLGKLVQLVAKQTNKDILLNN